MKFIDTHAHLDGEEFKEDLPDVIQRAKDASVAAIFIPGIDRNSVESVMAVCRAYPGYCYPMIGLQPEEVRQDWRDVLTYMKSKLDEYKGKESQAHQKLQADLASPSPSERIREGLTLSTSERTKERLTPSPSERAGERLIAIGECGLDFYWSREYEKEQLAAFEEQVKWSVETQLPLMIHCRKAQNELLHIMKPYEKELPGGVFHCFTGNQKEAEEYLRFDKFVLGVGGVSTFKSSHLREDLPAAVPLSRIVLETDSPYMAPVPNRGKRNESSYVRLVLENLARCYNVSDEEVARQTNENVRRVFGDYATHNV